MRNSGQISLSDEKGGTQANLWRCLMKFAYHLVHLKLLTPQGPEENLIFSEDADRSYSLKLSLYLSSSLFQLLSG